MNKRQQLVRINQFGGDNSFYRNGTKKLTITFGKGGVDDAEDAEVVVHEYGHAVQDDQVPGFGSSLEAGSIGEAFGDYLAVSVGLWAAGQNGWPVKTPPACVADWDSVSYTSDGAALPAPGRRRPRRSPTSRARCTPTARSGRGRCGTSATALGDTDGRPDHHQRAVLVQGRHQLRGRGDDHRAAAAQTTCTAPMRRPR